MTKKIIISIAIGLLGFSVFAQEETTKTTLTQNRHEISIWAGAGLGTFNNCDLTKGNYTPGLGYLAGLGYNYWFNYNWSLGIGAEFYSIGLGPKYTDLNPTVTLPLFTDQYTVADINSDLYKIKTEGIGDIKETQQAYYINVPLMAKYQIDICKKGHKFYTAFGAKLGIPVKASYKTTGTVVTEGQALTPDGTAPISGDWLENMPHHSFGEFSADKEGDLKLNLNVIAAVEAGFKWNLGKLCALYTGLYFDYGLNDVRKGKTDNQYFAYNRENPEAYTTNSILTSQYEGAPHGTKFSEFVNSTSAGLKLQLSFGWAPFNKKEAAKKSRKGNAGDNPTKVEVINFPDGDQPVTANQLQQIMKRNSEAVIAAEHEEFERLKEFLTPKSNPEEIVLLPIVGFDFDKKEILPSMHNDLDKAVEYLRVNSNTKVKLVGNTDNSGTNDYNYQLGLDRANRIRAYLIDHGISPARLLVDSKGTDNPAIPNTDEASRRYNRRVEFEILK